METTETSLNQSCKNRNNRYEPTSLFLVKHKYQGIER